jgi:hypothetical protein
VEEQFANGGEISTEDETTFCAGDENSIDVSVTNDGGANGQTVVWVITDADLNILELGGTPPFSFTEAGTYLIWRLGYVGALNGAEVGANAGNLSGDCFDLSNPITVTVEDCTPVCVVDGGTISTESPTTVFCKSDGESNVFTIDLEGAVGENGAYVVTFLDGEIILISESNTFDLEGVPGNGTCLFWHLSWTGELTGAVVGGNAADLAGECFDLSNSIEVEEQFANGGEISTEDETTFCAGDENSIDVSVTNDGGANGQTVVWVVTDANLNILELGGTPPFSFTEAGTYLIWRLGYVGALNGAEIGANAGDLTGDCFDLSNPITVTVEDCTPVCVVDGGTISTESPTTVFCKSDGESNVFTIDLEGAVGENGLYVVTFLDGEIILVSESNTFDLEGVPGNGTCLFWHLSWTGELTGAVVGGNASDITGDCFDLSNSIEVEEQFANGGTISTTVGQTAPVCINTLVPVSVSDAGGANGQNVAWVITSEDLTILNITTSGPFSFSMPGTYLIWRLGYVGTLNGASIGANAGDLTGDCFDLSNPLTIVVVQCLGDGLPSATVNAELNSLPNPTNGYNMVIFNTDFNGRVVLDVYDMSGRNIQTLFNQDIQQGVEYRVEFDGTALPNGVYIYRLTSDHGVVIHKFMVAR